MNLNRGIKMLVKRGNDDELTVLIDKMVDDLSSTSSRAIPSIHRVGDNLRSINEKAYDPMTVAIGPIHRDKPHLKSMDKREISDLFWPLSISTSASNLLQDGGIDIPPPHLLGLVHYAESLQFSPNLSNSTYEMKNINSASELKEAGIIFKNRNDIEEAHLLDIKFDKKIIYIPTLRIEHSTESKFRNLIAYEQYLPHGSQRQFTDYMFFMHCLIHDSRDAKLLRRCGVISTWAGGDEMVYHLIKQMGKNVQPSDMFSYGDVFEGVNRHCTKRKNTWMAVLRRDYFDSPWKVISLVAGFVLLGVAIVQMVFAILSHYQDPEKHK